MVVTGIQKWWLKVRIATNADKAILQIISKDVAEYKLRKMNRSKTTHAVENQRNIFLSKIRNTFWVVQLDYEAQLNQLQQQDKRDARYKEGWLYLEAVRGKNRKATLGSRDKKLVERRKRSFETQNSIETKQLALSKSTHLSFTATLSSGKSHSDNANEVLVGNSAATFSAKTDIETQGSSIFSLAKKRDRSTKTDGIPKQA